MEEGSSSQPSDDYEPRYKICKIFQVSTRQFVFITNRCAPLKKYCNSEKIFCGILIDFSEFFSRFVEIQVFYCYTRTLSIFLLKKNKKNRIKLCVETGVRPKTSTKNKISKKLVARPNFLPARPNQQMRLPIIRPKIPPKSSGPPVRLITSATPQPIAPSTSNPRPLISLLDRTEFRDRNRPALVPTRMMAKPKKCYYTEMADIRKEFGIPEALDTVKPNTMSGVGQCSDEIYLKFENSSFSYNFPLPLLPIRDQVSAR